MTEQIFFKKQRDIGEIITDIFKFIRTEWKQLGTMILKIAGPALLVLVIAASVYTQTAMGSLDGFAAGGSNFELFTGTVIISLLLMLLSAVSYFGLLYGTVLNYIKSYTENNGIVNTVEVSDGVKSKFWSLLGLGFMIVVMSFIGLMICILPGIYLGVVFGTSYAIHIFQKKDPMDTISYSFQFIKNEWWITFATYIVIYIIYYIVNLIFQIPLIIYMFVKTFAMIDEVSGNPADIFDWVYTALNAVSLIAQYLLQTILVIGTAFVYFNLNEKKNFTGTIETIDNIGTSS